MKTLDFKPVITAGIALFVSLSVYKISHIVDTNLGSSSKV